MVKFIFIFILVHEIFLFLLVKGANKNKSNNEQYLEDTLQMEYLKKK